MANGSINGMTPSQQAVNLSVLSHNFATGLRQTDRQAQQEEAVSRLSLVATTSIFLWPVLGRVGP